MKTRLSLAASAAFFSVWCIGASAQVENVVSVVSTDPAAQVEIMDAWLGSDDSDAGQRVSLLASVFNGAQDTTHIIVADFPDYESWEDLNDRRAGSAAWAQQTRASAGITNIVSSALMLRALDNGESWSEGDYLAVISISVEGRTGVAAYTAAFDKMFETDMADAAPGLIRLVRSRAGGGDHVALISAPSFVELNEYLDYFPTSDGYAAFVSEVDSISTLQGTEIYRIVRVWQK